MCRTTERWGAWIAVGVIGLGLNWLRDAPLPQPKVALGLGAGDAPGLLRGIENSNWDAMRGWARVQVPGPAASYPARNEARASLHELRRRGARLCGLVTAADYRWVSGVRDLPGTKGTLPVDLREAYQRGLWLGSRYSTNIDAWEIDNEPELVYVRDNPENYAAYLKAMYLGLKGGAARTDVRARHKRQGAAGRGTEDGGSRTVDRRQRPVDEANSWSLDLGTWHFGRGPRVVMAPMAFPPGPYFDALLANDLLSYTDGFNFHYYGYEEDFPGVYRQFEAAVKEFEERGQFAQVGKGGLVPESPTSALRRPVKTDAASLVAADQEVGGDSDRNADRNLIRKQLPIFVSEYGYGLLSGRTAATVDGRVRQWEYFRALAGHMRELRVQAPMAFVLSPYLEDGAREFGLTMGPAATAHPREPLATPPLVPNRTTVGGPFFSAGGAVFTPADFGVNAPEPWMREIGQRFGDFEISPALAWLLHQPPLPEPRAWDVRVSAPSPVVIDFVAGAGMRQSKSSRGHFLTQMSGLEAKGQGTIVLYNFGRKAMRGVLHVAGHAREPLLEQLELAPGERREISLTFAVDRQSFRAVRWKARFVPDSGAVPPARLQSFVYPEAVGLRSQVLADLQHAPNKSAANAANLDSRQLARGEAPLRPEGRWRVTKGLRVEESGRVWRFTVNGFPDETMRPTIAELPLPDGFTFQAFDIFAADIRLRARRAEDVAPVDEPRSEPEFSAIDKETVGFYFRSRDGGLYATTMHFPVSTSGMHFGQMAANFTPVFYGRMHLPWRFLENQPVSLVLIFRPRLLPATYEIRDARIVRLTK